jgi:hypothetical protein
MPASCVRKSAARRLEHAVQVPREPGPDQRREQARVVVPGGAPGEPFGIVLEPEARCRLERAPVGEREQLVPGDLSLAAEDVGADVADPLAFP